MKTRVAVISALLFFVALPASRAQWITQRVGLNPGWNAVYLEVQPEPRSCDQVFQNLPVQSVWKWDRRFSTVQFQIDPAKLLPEAPDWLMWLPPSDPRAFLNRLLELQGCQAYMIKVASNAAPFTWSVKGRAIQPRLDWYPHSLNLVGFPVSPRNPPTFSEFFKFTPEIDTSRGYANELYRLDAAGHGERIVQPARERMAPGVAYWVGCARVPQAVAALEVTPPAEGVDFGALLTERNVSIRNLHPTATLSLAIKQRDSESPPEGYPELAGPVPLSILSKNASNEWVWGFFPANGLSHTLLPGEEWLLRLGVRRQDLNSFTPQSTNGAAYQSILEITDSAESLLVRLPAMVAVPEAGTVTTGLDAHSDKEGLWVGQVTVNQVNAPAWPAYTTNLLPTVTPASFRLLVHVDGTNQARLLQQAVLAWDTSLNESPHTNGTYALYSEESALPANATDVKRISSVAFPIMSPVILAGSLGTNLTGEVIVEFDDPTNPFLHRYHPLHDNRDWDFKPYTNAVETRRIVRSFELQFTSDTNNPANPYWGVEALGGTYKETLVGLRAQPIQLQGAFLLERISQINTLR